MIKFHLAGDRIVLQNDSTTVGCTVEEFQALEPSFEYTPGSTEWWSPGKAYLSVGGSQGPSPYDRSGYLSAEKLAEYWAALGPEPEPEIEPIPDESAPKPEAAYKALMMSGAVPDSLFSRVDKIAAGAVAEVPMAVVLRVNLEFTKLLGNLKTSPDDWDGAVIAGTNAVIMNLRVALIAAGQPLTLEDTLWVNGWAVAHNLGLAEIPLLIPPAEEPEP